MPSVPPFHRRVVGVASIAIPIVVVLPLLISPYKSSRSAPNQPRQPTPNSQPDRGPETLAKLNGTLGGVPISVGYTYASENAEPSRLSARFASNNFGQAFQSKVGPAASQVMPTDIDEDPDTARKRIEYLRARSHYNEVPPEVRLKIAREEYERRRAEQKATVSEEPSDSNTWISIGP